MVPSNSPSFLAKAVTAAFGGDTAALAWPNRAARDDSASSPRMLKALIAGMGAEMAKAQDEIAAIRADHEKLRVEGVALQVELAELQGEAAARQAMMSGSGGKAPSPETRSFK